MTKWEYRCQNVFADEDRLDALGAEGWELVGFDDGLAYFKRPLEEAVSAGAVFKLTRVAEDARDVGATDATPWPVHGYG